MVEICNETITLIKAPQSCIKLADNCGKAITFRLRKRGKNKITTTKLNSEQSS